MWGRPSSIRHPPQKENGDRLSARNLVDVCDLLLACGAHSHHRPAWPLPSPFSAKQHIGDRGLPSRGCRVHGHVHAEKRGKSLYEAKRKGSLVLGVYVPVPQGCFPKRVTVVPLCAFCVIVVVWCSRRRYSLCVDVKSRSGASPLAPHESVRIRPLRKDAP